MNFFSKTPITILFLVILTYFSNTLADMQETPEHYDTIQTSIQEAVANYKQSLPNIEVTCLTPTAIAHSVTNFLFKFCPIESKITSENKTLLYHKILCLISHDQPLKLYLPGFPFKSTNGKKCISHRADLGDYLALFTLHHLVSEIRTIYHHTHLTIVSDGYPYTSLIDPAHEIIARYHQQLQYLISIIGQGQPPTIFFEDGLSITGRITSVHELQHMVNQMPLSEKEIHELEQDTAWKDYIEQDCHIVGLTEKQTHDVQKTTMHGTKKFGKFLKHFFPPEAYIRLSVHTHHQPQDKLTVRLLLGRTGGTPWQKSIFLTQTGRLMFEHNLNKDIHEIHLFGNNQLAFVTFKPSYLF